MTFFDEAFCAVRDRKIDRFRVDLQIAGKNNEDISNLIDVAKNLVKYAEHCAEMVRKKILKSPRR
jgi:hypothetical protein